MKVMEEAMTKFIRLTATCLVSIIILMSMDQAYAGPGHDIGGPPPVLGKDLAVRLSIPLFDPEFSETPVAVVGETPIFLKSMTPSLHKTKKGLFWESDTSAEELSAQFREALDNGISTEPPAAVEYFTDARITEGPFLSIEAPLFSRLFLDVPVALVNLAPVTVAEFSRNLQDVHAQASESEMDSGSNEKIRNLIERLVRVRLVEQEARNIGLDQTSSFRSQTDAFAERTLLHALLDKQTESLVLDRAEVDKLYRKVSLQGAFRSYRFELEGKAQALHDSYKEGGDFESLVSVAIERGAAVEEEQQGEIMFKDLLPQIATAASEMTVGEVSEVFHHEDGFIIFILEDKSFVEDPKALKFARQTIWENQTAEFAAKYIEEINNRHAEFNQDALDALDFSRVKAINPDISLGEALQPLIKDERILVSVAGADSMELSVADLARKIKETYFHGVDKPLDEDDVDQKKEELLRDALFRMTGTLEARKLGLDKAPEYLAEVAEYERGLLFDLFMQKVVQPEVRPAEEEIQKYYSEHQDEFMTPTMVNLKSLPFYRKEDAVNAAEKLRKGSDFKWVSANVEGLVDFQNPDLLPINDRILNLSSLPEVLQDEAADAKEGDVIEYAEPNGFYYVLYVQDHYPASQRPYEEVRKGVIEIVYRQAFESTLDEWVLKLKEAYEVKIFLSADQG